MVRGATSWTVSFYAFNFVAPLAMVVFCMVGAAAFCAVCNCAVYCIAVCAVSIGFVACFATFAARWHRHIVDGNCTAGCLAADGYCNCVGQCAAVAGDAVLGGNHAVCHIYIAFG